MSTTAPPLTIGAWLRIDAVRRGLARLAPVRVLEIGPGMGAMAARLANAYDYVALEPDPVSAAATSAVLDRLGRGVVHRGGAASLEGLDPFDVVCAFEVLEHQADDIGVLSEWSGLLGSRGGVVLSVPAKPDRFGPWDAAVGHLRRYTRESLAQVLDSAGFDSVTVEAWGVGLGDVLELARNRLAERIPRPDRVADRTARSGRLYQTRSRSHGVVNAAVAAPFRLAQYPLRRSSLGTGLVATGRRRD